jgi:pantothenate kinase
MPWLCFGASFHSVGSFFSLCSYLTGMDSWDEIMEASKVGMSEHVDILVGDIYGHDDTKYAELGLKAQVIASRYGLYHICLLSFFFRRLIIGVICFSFTTVSSSVLEGFLTAN